MNTTPQRESPFNTWRMVIMMVLTLGLAPYYPEPHIFGKVKWLLGGAVGMKPMDWFDTVLHGFPWLLLIRLIVIKGLAALKK